MFVITRTPGDKFKNDRRYSHPSTTRYLLFPATKLVRPMALSPLIKGVPESAREGVVSSLSNNPPASECSAPFDKGDCPSKKNDPIITVGSSPASIIIFATIAVVVVLPCVPVIAMVYLSREMIPSASGYDNIGIPRFFA